MCHRVGFEEYFILVYERNFSHLILGEINFLTDNNNYYFLKKEKQYIFDKYTFVFKIKKVFFFYTSIFGFERWRSGTIIMIINNL